MKIYISTPAANGVDRTEEDVRKRVEELGMRLKEKFGYDYASHLDSKTDGKFPEKLGGNIAVLLECDGIVCDNLHHLNRACSIEEAVAKNMSQWKKPFKFLHTKEEFDFITDKYVV